MPLPLPLPGPSEQQYSLQAEGETDDCGAMCWLLVMISVQIELLRVPGNGEQAENASEHKSGKRSRREDISVCGLIISLVEEEQEGRHKCVWFNYRRHK